MNVFACMCVCVLPEFLVPLKAQKSNCQNLAERGFFKGDGEDAVTVARSSDGGSHRSRHWVAGEEENHAQS